MFNFQFVLIEIYKTKLTKVKKKMSYENYVASILQMREAFLIV